MPFNKNGLEGAAAARNAAVVPLACPWSRAPIRRHLQAAPWQYAPDVAASAVHARGEHRGLRLLGGVQLPGLSSKPLLTYAFRWIRKLHTHRCQGDSTKKNTITGQAITSAHSTVHICKHFNSQPAAATPTPPTAVESTAPSGEATEHPASTTTTRVRRISHARPLAKARR